MATNIVQMKDGSGNNQYPVTSAEAVGMPDGSGNLQTYLNKRVTELNISVLYPTNGEGGTNKYTLAGAIAQVPQEYRTVVGLKITFINDGTSKPETWVYNGSTFTNTSNWKQGSGYEDFVGLIPSESMLPNIDTVSNILDLGDDPVLRIGERNYALKSLVQDASKYRSISLVTTRGTAFNLVFNTLTYEFKLISYTTLLANNEVCVGSFRFSVNNANGFLANLPFDYTVNGSSLADRIGLSFVFSRRPVIDFKNMILDLGDKPILYIGGVTYNIAQLVSDTSKYRSIPLYTEYTSKAFVYTIFNINTYEFYSKNTEVLIKPEEIIIGTVSLKTTFKQRIIETANFEFDFDTRYNDLQKYSEDDFVKIKNYSADAYSYGFLFDLKYVNNIRVSLKSSEYSVAVNLFENEVPLENATTGALYAAGWKDYYYNSFSDAPANANYAIVIFRKKEGTCTAADIAQVIDYIHVESRGDIHAIVLNSIKQIKEGAVFKSNSATIKTKTPFEFCAHRGFHLNGVPENSLDAYRYAGYLGFKYAETDFNATSDGTLVLMHDDTINRTMRNSSDYSAITETVNVKDKTLDELRTNYVLASTDPRMRRPIPTLEEYFITCKNSGLFPIPEIKKNNSNEDVQKAFELGKRILGESNFGFASFSYALLDYARSLSDKIQLWYIGGSILSTTNSVTGKSRETEQTIWYPSYQGSYGFGITKELVEQYRQKGLKVAIWSPPVSDLGKMFNLGPDIIATDTISPNLNGSYGLSLKSNIDFNDFNTTGTIENGIIKLDAKETLSYDGDQIWLGSYYLSIIAKGSFRITAPNLKVDVVSESTDRFIYQGLIDNKKVSLLITANSDSDIEFVEFYSTNFF